MSFQSYGFLLLFLPLTLLFYSISIRHSSTAAKIVMLLASIIFYAWNSPVGLIVPAVGIFVSYFFATIIQKNKNKAVLAFSMLWHIAILCFFKYTHILSTPLGLSFFTFQQLWFLLEVWRGHVGTTNILDYSIFLYFSLRFPQAQYYDTINCSLN